MSKNILKGLKKYENKWVALTFPGHKVVGSGDDAAAAQAVAQRKGHKNPLLYKVLPLDKLYIGSAYEV